MVQILPARPNIGNSIGEGIHRGLSTYLENEKQQGKNQELQQALASLSQQPNQQNLSPEQKYLQFAQAVAGRPDSKDLSQNYLESLKQTQAARPEQQAPNPGINALAQLESLIGQEGIGFQGAFNLSGKSRFNRGKFKSLQSALLPLFKANFPRGMTEKEFKIVMDEWIPRPDDTEDTIRGKIEGLKQLISGQGMPQQMQQQQGTQQSQRPPLDSFFR